MNARTSERADASTGSVPRLRTGLEGMMTALDAGEPYLPGEKTAEARATLEKAAERMSISGGHTVVALAGATGSGKSTMFNAFVGALVSDVGRLRPTTTSTCAAVWGEEPATELLDWLGVKERHRVPENQIGRAGDVDLDGLVLLDLPDFDSYKAEHRAEVDRVLALADVFVWVTDPQKYADAVLHDEYLTKASDHRTVSLVLLNQADRLTEAEQEACRADLERLLERDGLGGTEVLLTSSISGQGLPELGLALAGAVAAKTAARERLIGDIHRHARALREYVGETEPVLPENVAGNLVSALGRTAGVPIVLDAVEKDYRRQAVANTGWPFVRWARNLKPDPMKRLRLEAKKHPKEVTAPPEGFGELLQRSSLPAASPTSRAGVELATRRLSMEAVTGLPKVWATAVENAVQPAQDDLSDALDQAVMSTPLGTRRPLWWSLVGLLQWVAAIAVVVGALWLVVIGAISWLQLPQPEVPRIGYVPVPTVLLAAGLLLGLLLATLSRPFARIGARRRREQVSRRLDEAIGDVAQQRIVDPVQQVLDAHRATREGLDAALAS